MKILLLIGFLVGSVAMAQGTPDPAPPADSAPAMDSGAGAAKAPRSHHHKAGAAKKHGKHKKHKKSADQ